MLKNQQPPSRALWAAFAAACALGLALDLGTKQWAWDTLRPPTGGPVVVWDRVLELSFAYNRGSAFGVVPQLDYPIVLLLITIGLAAWIVALMRSPGASVARFVGGGLVVSGALGNLHDRFLRVDAAGAHGVVDFIRVYYPWGGSWPNFNVADANLVIGVLLLMWSLRSVK